jgi:hypothetical protein
MRDPDCIMFRELVSAPPGRFPRRVLRHPVFHCVVTMHASFKAAGPFPPTDPSEWSIPSSKTAAFADGLL